MSFLGLYRDPVIAQVTSRCDWRIADLVEGGKPTSLYLVIPPSDISRTKPLIRLILNQIGRRLTEELKPKSSRHRVLFMLDEFPALGRLDFFESVLAFMVGYGLKAFLIAQSLNQIDNAYGPNHAILDNCHVRVSFATNDERTAKRVSDALGTATEMRAMKNYAGHRLSPWLGHLMVSRSETARPLLTQGEMIQLPKTDEVVLVSGVNPTRAKKARYYLDPRFQRRILPPPPIKPVSVASRRTDDWSALPVIVRQPKPKTAIGMEEDDIGGLHIEPELPYQEGASPEPMPDISNEFDFDDKGSSDEESTRAKKLRERMQRISRQASLDPGDGIEL
jgi:type IV secretion system protein VirD4